MITRKQWNRLLSKLRRLQWANFQILYRDDCGTKTRICYISPEENKIELDDAYRDPSRGVLTKTIFKHPDSIGSHHTLADIENKFVFAREISINDLTLIHNSISN
jgi:hypothetical protein